MTQAGVREAELVHDMALLYITRGAVAPQFMYGDSVAFQDSETCGRQLPSGARTHLDEFLDGVVEYRAATHEFVIAMGHEFRVQPVAVVETAGMHSTLSSTAGPKPRRRRRPFVPVRNRTGVMGHLEEASQRNTGLAQSPDMRSKRDQREGRAEVNAGRQGPPGEAA